MKPCYHFTNKNNLEQILTEGLKPTYGVNSQLISDKKGERVYYSVGEEATIKIYISFDSMISRALDGRITPELYETYSEELKQKLNTSTDISSWLGEGIYLVFDGDKLQESNEDKKEDSYTSETINLEDLYVCVLKNQTTGEIVSAKDSDIVNFFIAARTTNYNEVLNIAGFYGLDIGDKVEELRNSNYVVDYIPLSEYYNLTISNEEEKTR